MASGLQFPAEMEFTGQGSQSAAMQNMVMVAQVVGQVTGDEQLLAIAQGLGQQGGGGGQTQQPPRENAMVGGVSPPQESQVPRQRGLVNGA